MIDSSPNYSNDSHKLLPNTQDDGIQNKKKYFEILIKFNLGHLSRDHYIQKTNHIDSNDINKQRPIYSQRPPSTTKKNVCNNLRIDI